MSVTDQLAFAGSVARVAGIVARERVVPPPRAAAADDVPVSVEALSTVWLSAVLCAGCPGAAVTDFELGSGSDGTSSRRALRVTYNAAGREAGLPVQLYTKSTPRLTSRVLLGVTAAAGAEALFYASIRGHLKGIGAPAGYVGAWDPRTCRSMVITEDVTATRGATFGNAAIHVDRPGAESMVRELAGCHGALWEDPRLDREWTALRDTVAWQRNFNARTRFDVGAMLGFRLAGGQIPPELRARRSEVRAAFMRSLELNARMPRTLLHQDVHPGNWFRVPDGTLHLYDWQGIAKGNWALDFAYAISAGLAVEDRRAWERDLLALYLERLAAAGGRPPAFDDAWLAYRQQLFHGLIFWTYTLLVGKVSELQPESHVRTIIARVARAMVDLESLDSLV